MTVLRACLCSTLLLPMLAMGDPLHYTVTPLAGLAGSTDSGAVRINDAGQAAGYACFDNGVSRYFVYDGQSASTIPGITAVSQVTMGLSSNGAFVASTMDAAGKYPTFVYQNGGTRMLGSDIAGEAINGSGQIAGEAYSPATHAILDDNGTIINLNRYGGSWSTATAINDKGQVVGTASLPGDASTHAWMYDHGYMTDLALPDGHSTGATDVNELGDVVGYYVDLSAGYGTHPFYFHAGQFTLLPSPGDADTALALNNLGLIVGRAGNYQAALWSQGQLYMLSDLLVDGGWTNLEASDVNDAGQIAGRACRGNVCEAVIFNPVSAVPEPGAWAMLGAGLLPLLLRRRGRNRPGARCAPR